MPWGQKYKQSSLETIFFLSNPLCVVDLSDMFQSIFDMVVVFNSISGNKYIPLFSYMINSRPIKVLYKWNMQKDVCHYIKYKRLLQVFMKNY